MCYHTYALYLSRVHKKFILVSYLWFFFTSFIRSFFFRPAASEQRKTMAVAVLCGVRILAGELSSPPSIHASILCMIYFSDHWTSLS